jgi:hypothetical protein
LVAVVAEDNGDQLSLDNSLVLGLSGVWDILDLEILDNSLVLVSLEVVEEVDI